MPARIRPNVEKMAAYKPGKPVETVQRELGLKEVVKLASNENPLGPSPSAMRAVLDAVGGMNVYPDASGHALRSALATRFGVGADQILLGNGSDERMEAESSTARIECIVFSRNFRRVWCQGFRRAR